MDLALTTGPQSPWDREIFRAAELGLNELHMVSKQAISVAGEEDIRIEGVYGSHDFVGRGRRVRELGCSAACASSFSFYIADA
jgi:hypothetical protein